MRATRQIYMMITSSMGQGIDMLNHIASMQGNTRGGPMAWSVALHSTLTESMHARSCIPLE
jgi:hypothetical protein